MNKKNCSTKSEKWRHTCNSVEIAWTNEQKVAVTSYGRNKNHDDEIKKNIAGQVLTYNSKNFHWLYRKLDIERTMSGLGKPFRKKIRSKKIEKTVKIRVKLPHVNKKPIARQRIFVQTPCSRSTLKSERKKFTPQNHSLFRSTSCFGVTKITTPIWLQKSWKCVNRS